MSGTTNVVGPKGASRGPGGGTCPPKRPGDGGCPVCRGLWPASTWGKAAIIVVALAALGVLVGYETMRSDLSKRMARYEGLKAAGRHDDAAKLLGEILDDADALYRGKKFDEAAKAFEWVVAKDPKRAVALERLGVMARDRGDADKAAAWFQRASEVDPLTPTHFYNLAPIHYSRKNYAACEASLDPAIRLAPVKSQYRLLNAFCAQESNAPADVVKARYRATVAAAEAQAQTLAADDLAPDGSLAKVWRTAAERLDKLGDPFGWDRLRKLVTDPKSRDARDFAKKLLADANRK